LAGGLGCAAVTAAGRRRGVEAWAGEFSSLGPGGWGLEIKAVESETLDAVPQAEGGRKE